jgi:hypothetical protein
VPKLNSRRGFALIAALLLAAATVAIAVGLHVASGGARVSAIHVTSGERAEVIAAAGMQRAEAFALAASRNKKDFDKVLDPFLEQNCSIVSALTNSTQPTESSYMNLPRLNGQTTVSFNNKRWAQVSFDGGAYLIRYDDDDDDHVAATGTPDWTGGTNNNLGTVGSAPFCAEGPVTALGIQNRWRDRNRAIWATVIGIYPGTNPATAQHKSVMRKLIVDNRIVGPAGLRLGGALTAQNSGAEMTLCSETSGISAQGIITEGNSNSCGCGTVNASNDFTLGQCTTCCGSNTYAEEDSTPGPAVNEPAATDAKWYDWTSSCTIYMGLDGLYFWDATALRGPSQNCGAYAGAFALPSVDTANIGSCWVPLFKSTAVAASGSVPITALEQTTAAGYSSTGDTEVVPCTFGATGNCYYWKPRNKVVAYDLTSYYTLGTYSKIGNKPNWATCQSTATSSFKWNPPSTSTGSGAESVGCTTCDGAHDVIQRNGATWAWNWGTGGDGATDRTSLPTAVYVYEGSLVTGPTTDDANSQSPSTQWPMATLIVKGSYTLNNADRFSIGVGTRKNEFMSLVVDGNLTVDSGARFAAAGSVYVRGNYIASPGGGQNGGNYLFGQLVVNGNVTIGAGSRLNWDYDTDLAAANANSPKPPRLSFPMGF